VGRAARFGGAAAAWHGQPGVCRDHCSRQGGCRPRTHRCFADGAFVAHCGVCFDRLGEHHLYRMSILFNRAEKRLMNAYYSFPLPCFISTLLLCTSPAQFQPSSSCTAYTRLQGAVSPWRSHKASFFRSVTVFRLVSLLFLTTTISFLAFCLPRPPCHTLHSHISLLHSSCSPSSLPAPVTSSSSIMYHLLPPLLA
jgi:hypothetical protein